ncbi:MAG: sugar ABC transporter permease [Nitrososphaeria archaeon]
MNKHVFLILPSILIVLFIGIIPTISLINYSLQNPFTDMNKFLGFENFRRVLTDYRVSDALLRNLYFSAAALLIEIPLGVGLAKLLYEKSKVNTITSIVITLPVLIPPITVGLLWRLLTYESGPFTNFVKMLGLYYNPFRNPTQAFWTTVLVDVWHWTPLVVLVISAALAGMDRSPVLSAKTEGATTWQIFRFIELPAISFPLAFITLLRLIDTLKVYDEPTVMFAGGPGLTTEYLSLYVKKVGVDQWLIGYASALSLIYNFIVLCLCIMLVNILTRGRGLL